MVLWNAISEKMLFISAERVEDGLYKNSRNKTCWMRKVKIWMSLVLQKRKDEKGFSLYSWRKTYQKVSEMNSGSFLEEAWTSKVTDGKGGPKLLGDQRYKIFNLLFSHNSYKLLYGRILLWCLKILKDKPDTDSIVVICFSLPSTYT